MASTDSTTPLFFFLLSNINGFSLEEVVVTNGEDDEDALLDLYVLLVYLCLIFVLIIGMTVQEHAGNEKSCVWQASDYADGELKEEMFCMCFASIDSFREAIQGKMGSRGWCGLHHHLSHKGISKSNFWGSKLSWNLEGRLLQHMYEAPNFECSQLQIFVLDEADRILDTGFKKEMNTIISQLPKKRETLLFSATQIKSVQDLARLSLRDPEYVSVHEEAITATPKSLQQTATTVPLHQK